MPRGEHDRHEIKSQSDLERVWVSLDDEGNELGYHVEPLGTTQSIPLAEHLGPFSSVLPITQGPVRVNRGLIHQTVLGFLSGLAGAGLVEAVIHYWGI